MKINGLKLPAELEIDLVSGGRKLSSNEIDRLKSILNKIENPLPRLFSHEQIIKENELWESESAKYYFGKKGSKVFPGDIDPEKVLIIGSAEPDSPIVLDYRSKDVSVAYLGDLEYESYWIEIASSYRELIEKLTGRVK